MATFALFDDTGVLYLLQTVAPGPGATYVDITNVNPQPNVGWTTADGGATWVPPGAGSYLGNQASLFGKAQTALSNNIAFLNITNPSNAQAIAQIQALTRQVNALIRLAVGDLSDQTGT